MFSVSARRILSHMWLLIPPLHSLPSRGGGGGGMLAGMGTGVSTPLAGGIRRVVPASARPSGTESSAWGICDGRRLKEPVVPADSGEPPGIVTRKEPVLPVDMLVRLPPGVFSPFFFARAR